MEIQIYYKTFSQYRRCRNLQTFTRISLQEIVEQTYDVQINTIHPYLAQFTLETNLIDAQSIIPAPDSIVCDNLEFTLSCYDVQEYKPLKYNIVLNIQQSQENEYFHKIAAQKFIYLVKNYSQAKIK